MTIPRLIKIRQKFESAEIADIGQSISQQFRRTPVEFKPGESIAVAVGSRGIANMAEIVRAVVHELKLLGTLPFIVPAMGSHGGATAEGQRQVLESYGITEEYAGVPIRSSMQVVELANDGLVNRVYMDKYAYDADGIVVINRVKPHTDFHGLTESGLLKMCVIGLGKHKQALEIHKYGVYGLREFIRPTARQVLKTGKIRMGIGIVENAYDRTCILKGVTAEDMEEAEIELLEAARKIMPSLPVKQLDVLVVDEIGKSISGTGMDTNIIGRIRIAGEAEPEFPKITAIVAADLNEESRGNALGIGLADFTTRRLFDKINLKDTYENVVTSTFVERGKLPVIAESDREAVQYALRISRQGGGEENIRFVRIKNTLQLSELYVSKSVYEEIKDNPNIQAIGDFADLLDEKGVLVPFGG